MKENPTFFDFLHLAELDLTRYDWIVFGGVSGSGKSTAIRWLQDNCPDPNRIVVDEIQTVKELLHLIRKRKSGLTYLIASHVPIPLHRILKPLTARQKVFQTDKNYGQIEAWLEANYLTFSNEAIQSFLRKYEASFVDLKFIANSSSLGDFDTALHQFEKLQKIERTPERK